MSTPRFQDVLNQIVVAVVNAINADDITAPTQVGIGWPTGTEFVAILNNQQYQVTVFDRKGTMRSTARYPVANLFQIGNPTSTLVATIGKPSSRTSPWTLTLSGSVGQGANVVAVVGAPAAFANVPLAANTTLSAAATAIAAAINALNVAGTSATASGAVVSISGSPICLANVSGTGYVLAQEVNRIARSVQVSIWCPNPDLRFVVSDAIQSGVGTLAAPFLTLSDGTQAYCVLQGGSGSEVSDDSQSSYSAYVEHLIFGVEYGILKTQTGYPIQVVESEITVGSGTDTILAPN